MAKATAAKNPRVGHPLHVANDGDSVLVDAYGKIDVPDSAGSLPLHVAASRVGVVTALLAKRADIDAPDGEGRTALELAFMSGGSGMRVAMALMKKGAHGKGLVHAAASGGSADMVQLALSQFKKGKEQTRAANEQDEMGRTPFMMAVLNGHPRSAELLKVPVDAGVEEVIGDQQYSLLHVACTRRGSAAADLVKLLTATAGYDVNQQDANGRTPLHVTADEGGGDTDVTGALLDAGANVAATDISGRTPMHSAAGKGRLRMIVCPRAYSCCRWSPSVT